MKVGMGQKSLLLQTKLFKDMRLKQGWNMTAERRVKAAADNLALIRADYEAGLCSKRKVAQKHCY